MYAGARNGNQALLQTPHGPFHLDLSKGLSVTKNLTLPNTNPAHTNLTPTLNPNPNPNPNPDPNPSKPVPISWQTRNPSLGKSGDGVL
eukprot:81743-Amorphochlora_amoeboformis.AAC.1